MAPFAPFLSESTFKELTGLESVHLERYPEAQESLMNSTLEEAVDKMQQVILLGRQKRIQENVKVKTPLRRLEIIHQDQTLLSEMGKLEEFIKGELNIKDVGYKTNEADFIRLFAKANLPVLGKKLGKEMGKYKGAIESLGYQTLQLVEAGKTTTLMGVEFSPEEILVYREAKAGTQALTNRFITINMDCTLDQELIDEGLAREIINRIQQARKSANLNVADRVKAVVVFEGPEKAQLEGVLLKHKNYIASETLAVDLTVQSSHSKAQAGALVLETNCSIALEVQ
jgi:isoleucyl-tRNA synthetase